MHYLSREVPVATIRHGYFDTLKKIMQTGFPFPKLEISGMDGNGPDVEKLRDDKNYLKTKYPDLAYFDSCKVMQRNIHITRLISEDHPDSVQKHKGKDGISIPSSSSVSSSSAKAASEHQHQLGRQWDKDKDKGRAEGDDAETTEEKSLEEYLLGGESRTQRLDGKDAMSIANESPPAAAAVAAAAAAAAAVPVATVDKPKPPVLPSGLSGYGPFRVAFAMRSGAGEALGDIIVEVPRLCFPLCPPSMLLCFYAIMSTPCIP
jgi:hypothetical protein